MTRPAIVIGTKWTGCRLNVSAGSNFGTVTPQDFTAVDGAEDVDSCATFHALIKFANPEEGSTGRILTLSQTNNENGYKSDDVTVEVPWGGYFIAADGNGAFLTEFYVPVPLDGRPVAPVLELEFLPTAS